MTITIHRRVIDLLKVAAFASAVWFWIETICFVYRAWPGSYASIGG